MEFQYPILAGAAAITVPATIMFDRYVAKREKPLEVEALQLPDPDQANLIVAELKKTNYKKTIGAYLAGVAIACSLFQLSNPSSRGPEKIEQVGLVLGVGDNNNPETTNNIVNGAIDAAATSPAKDNIILDGSSTLTEATWSSGSKTDKEVRELDKSIGETLDPFSSNNFTDGSTESNAIRSVVNSLEGPSNIILVTGSNDGSDLANLGLDINDLPSDDQFSVVEVNDPTAASDYPHLNPARFTQASNTEQVDRAVTADIKSKISEPPPHPINWPKDVAIVSAGFLVLAALERRFNGAIKLSRFHNKEKK